MRTTKRSLSLVILLLASSSAMFAMDAANARYRQERERQEAEAKRRQQEQIDRKMREDIKKAGSTKTVQINPNTSFNVRCKATNHNITATHNQFMQNQKRK